LYVDLASLVSSLLGPLLVVCWWALSLLVLCGFAHGGWVSSWFICRVVMLGIWCDDLGSDVFGEGKFLNSGTLSESILIGCGGIVEGWVVRAEFFWV